MCVHKKGNGNTKRLFYTTVVHPIPEYMTACWNPCRKRDVNTLYRVEKKAAQFTHFTKESDWKTMGQCRR
jgi:hypothetical protein